MKAAELLNSYRASKYFILDSHQNAMSEQEAGHQYEDSDYIGYGYNFHQFNQLTEGSFFLYRRPAKLSPDRKFHIYGGGVVETISEPDENGNVTARIKHGFEFDNPISQGDPFIENYSWKTRNKPGPGWKGFWLNYGMNEIVGEDFWYLVNGRTCIMKGTQLSEIQTAEENEAISYSSLESGFVINLREPSITGAAPTTSRVSLAKKIDFSALNERRKTIGTAGELIVLEYENERLAKSGINKQAEHVAQTIGDGLGYDIRSYDENGTEIHIEVKTTKTNHCDSFYMSKREIEESKNPDYKYRIYRVYNYNEKTKTASLMIYDGAVTAALFDLEPVSFKIKRKQQ